VLVLVESMVRQQLRDGGLGESVGVDGFGQRWLSGKAFIPTRGRTEPCGAPGCQVEQHL
jgi:hypothetical protein